MNNDNNNIELPKRIDEVNNQPDPNVLENNVVNSDPVVENTGIEVLPDNEIVNEIPITTLPNNNSEIPVTPLPNVDVNIFDQNTNINDIDESILNQTIDEVVNTPDLELNETVESDILTLATPETPATPEEIGNNDAVEENIIPEKNSEIVNNEPISSEPLNKKVLVEKPIIKEKPKGNALVGFLAVFLILAIILAALYYFIKMDYIKLPNEIKDKIPFLVSPTTNTTTTTTQRATDNLNDNEPINVVGEFLEADPVICPDVQTTLSLRDDLTFTYTELNYNETTNECSVNELNGNYNANNGILQLVADANEENTINANYRKTEVTLEIEIQSENKPTIFLYDINER